MVMLLMMLMMMVVVMMMLMMAAAIVDATVVIRDGRETGSVRPQQAAGRRFWWTSNLLPLR
eukprot:7363007-Pyramimonas_sp.AAC.1